MHGTQVNARFWKTERESCTRKRKERGQLPQATCIQYLKVDH